MLPIPSPEKIAHLYFSAILTPRQSLDDNLPGIFIDAIYKNERLSGCNYKHLVQVEAGKCVAKA